MSLDYSIVIPAFNESARIGKTLERVLECVHSFGWNAEVLVVNDGSTDNTAAIIQSYAAQDPIVRLINNPGNHGKGYSVRNGMLQASGEIVMFTDADLSAPMEEAEMLFAAIHEGADIAIGSRWLERTRQTIQQPLYRQFFGRCFNAITKNGHGFALSPTRNAASRHSNGRQLRPSFNCSESSGGASIRKYSLSP